MSKIIDSLRSDGIPSASTGFRYFRGFQMYRLLSSYCADDYQVVGNEDLICSNNGWVNLPSCVKRG